MNDRERDRLLAVLDAQDAALDAMGSMDASEVYTQAGAALDAVRSEVVAMSRQRDDGQG